MVISASEELARCINPSYSEWGKPWSSWANSPKDVSVTYIGTTDESSLNEGDIICSSFNAG